MENNDIVPEIKFVENGKEALEGTVKLPEECYVEECFGQLNLCFNGKKVKCKVIKT